MLEPLPRFSDILPSRVAADPDATAVVFGDLRWTYAELCRRVDDCARAMLGCGAARGDRVATLSTPRPEYLVVYLAAVKIGAIWVGLNPVQQLDEYRYLLSDSRPTLLFALDRFRNRDNHPIIDVLQTEFRCLKQVVVFGETPSQCLTYSEFLDFGRTITPQSLAERAAAVLPEDVALLVYTSGSTGKPKGAMLTHRNVAFGAALYHWRWPVRPLRTVCNLPVSHIACSTEIVAHVLAAGGTLIFQEYFDAEAFMRAIAAERITWISILPTMMQRILQLPGWDKYDTGSLQAVVFGGAAMSADMIEKFGCLCGNIFTLWGLTESTVAVTFTDPGDDLDTLARSIGRPGPDCEVAIMNEGQEAPAGTVGEVVIRGDCVFSGYFGVPGATAAMVDAEGWLHSGDLGKRDEAGRFYIVGRIKEMFKSGGYNVYPREVEAVIEEHPTVALCAVVPIADGVYQEVGVAYISPAPNQQVSPEEIEAHCRARLGNYKVPKRFVVSSNLPMLAIGKIDKVALRKSAAETFERP
jgi:acyl-CoA synthetase (AMP-forming)/AMP-acid ligase II